MNVDLRLPGGPMAPAFARSVVEGLSSDVPGPVLEDLRLLVSEVVTNSVRHAGAGPDSAIHLRVVAQPQTVRLEVKDQGPRFDPTPRPWAGPRESGWGLYLVDRIADRWGVDFDGGTRVWLEIEHPGRAA